MAKHPKTVAPMMGPVTVACAVGLLTLLVSAVPSGCTEEFPIEQGLLSFEVTATNAAQVFGTEAKPLKYEPGGPCAAVADCNEGSVCLSGMCAYKMTIDVQAIDRSGNPWPHFSGDVTLRVTPGDLVGQTTIRVEAGVATAQDVYFTKGRAKTHIWVEDDGYVPHDKQYGQCSDGIDNDNNGLIDQADPGCQGLDDDLEAPVSLVTGVSPTAYFDNPTIHDVQNGPTLHQSPLRGAQVSITSGTLVVANVLASGFYLVDLRDNGVKPGVPGTTDKFHNAMFIFTFSKPDNLNYGDRLCGVSGSVQDFVGATQLSFPSYVVYNPDDPPAECTDFEGFDPDAKVPDAWEATVPLENELDTSLALTDYFARVYKNSLFLEQYEGNLIRFSDLEVATRFISCDRNKNGTIDRGTEEISCRNDCQDEALCTDLESYVEFNQYAAVTAGKKKVYGSTLLATAFSPLDIGFVGDDDASGRCTKITTEAGFLQYDCTPLKLETMTGSLRQIYLCGEDSDNARCDLQFWVVDPRFDSDVVVEEL